MSRLLSQFHYQLSADASQINFEDKKTDVKSVHSHFAVKVSTGLIRALWGSAGLL